MATWSRAALVITMDEGVYSKQEIQELLESEETDIADATAFDLACSDGIIWLSRSAAYEADYLLDCLNERYDRPMIMNAVETVPNQSCCNCSSPARPRRSLTAP